jgi:phosphoglycolate phosphatase-like HAD superfamily hydrolase
MKKFSLIIFLSFAFLVGLSTYSNADQIFSVLDIQSHLRSWNAGPSKEKIVSFVNSVSDPANNNFVPIEYRRAFFDMDGTILCEKPDYIEVALTRDYIEVALTRHRLLEKVRLNPQLKSNPIYQAVIEGDSEYLYKNIKTAIAEAFEGESLKFYLEYSRRFLSAENHPRFKQPYVQLFYQPMIELIDYLTDHGFKVYIVSTSQQEFIRSVSKDILNIPRDQIIGTMVGFSLQFGGNNNPVFIRKSSYFEPYNADENKVVRIRERGLLPSIFAFGNSSGDLAMLEVTAASGFPNMVCILDHDDPEREFEYHKSNLLKTAKKNAWTVVSMKRDFKVLFPFNQ